jgi:acetyl esterase/lipase
VRSSGEAYARQLAAADVDATVHLEPCGATHGGLSEPNTPQGVRTLDRMADWLTAAR